MTFTKHQKFVLDKLKGGCTLFFDEYDGRYYLCEGLNQIATIKRSTMQKLMLSREIRYDLQDKKYYLKGVYK